MRRQPDPGPGTVRVACPVCHVLHDTDPRAAGCHLWDLCPGCLREEDRLCRDGLAERGIVLPWHPAREGGAD